MNTAIAYETNHSHMKQIMECCSRIFCITVTGKIRLGIVPRFNISPRSEEVEKKTVAYFADLDIDHSTKGIVGRSALILNEIISGQVLIKRCRNPLMIHTEKEINILIIFGTHHSNILPFHYPNPKERNQISPTYAA